MVNNTFNVDFSIADSFGASAVQDTYNRAFKEWKDDSEMLTALVVTLNHKIWQHYRASGQDNTLVQLYNKLWQQAHEYAVTHLKGDELDYYLKITD